MGDPNRVFLREFEPRDAIRLFEIESSPEMVRYQHFEPRTMESARKYVEEAIAGQSEQPRSCIEFAVCDAKSGEMLGRVGTSITEGVAWIWYVIDAAHQGRGIAKEAVTLFLEHLNPNPEIRTFHIECDPRNVPSWRLAESLGFTLVSETDSGLMIKGEDCGSKLYVLLTPDSNS